MFVAGRKFEYLKERMLGYEELMKLPVMCLEGNTSHQDVCGAIPCVEAGDDPAGV